MTDKTKKKARLTTPDDPCSTACCSGVQANQTVEGPEPGLWPSPPNPPAAEDAVPVADVGNYDAWGVVPFELCEVGPQIQFEGHFNSFIRGINGWNVGYLDHCKVPYTKPIESITIEDIWSALGVATCNVIGSQDYPADGVPGYYAYTPPGQLQYFTRYVVAWKCCIDVGTGYCTKVKYYVIKVTALDANVIPVTPPTPPDLYFTSEVTFDYRCFVVDCPPETPEAKAKAKPFIDAVINKSKNAK